MAAQYSNRQFFRKTPNQYLAQYFSAKEILLDIDISEFNETSVDVLQDALNALSDGKKSEIEAEFQDVNALACHSHTQNASALNISCNHYPHDASTDELNIEPIPYISCSPHMQRS